MITLKNKYGLAFLPWIITFLLSPPYNFKKNFQVTNSIEDAQFYETVIEQIEEIKPMKYPPESHESKMEVRILPPLLLRCFSFIKLDYIPIIIYLLNLIFLFCLFYQINKFQEIHASGLIWKNILSLQIATIYTGINYLMDFWPMFDGWAFLLIMLFINSNNITKRIILFSLALFVDERSIFPLIASIVFLNINRANWKQEIIKITLLSLSIYFISRIFLAEFVGLRSPFIVSKDVHIFNFISWTEIHFLIISTINCFKGLWIFYIYLLLYTLFWSKKPSLEVVLYLLLMMLTFSASVSVMDFTRSMSYGFPIILFSIVLIHREKLKIINWLEPIFWTNLIIPITFFHSAGAIYYHEDLFTKISIMIFQQIK
jgi:hypothetical protein